MLLEVRLLIVIFSLTEHSFQSAVMLGQIFSADISAASSASTDFSIVTSVSTVSTGSSCKGPDPSTHDLLTCVLCAVYNLTLVGTVVPSQD